MTLLTEPYLTQSPAWPPQGPHIMAQYDDQSIVVYQAYRPAIGIFAARHAYFGGEFSLGRMSWIKPNFPWMMYRCGWGTKEGQEVTLAIRLKRAAFDTILANAVESSYNRASYPDQSAWKAAVATSDVRLQWDPDHDPTGKSLPRRALQLGLRGETLALYSLDWIISIEDISDFVSEQHAFIQPSLWAHLLTPTERPYLVQDSSVAARLGLSASVSST